MRSDIMGLLYFNGVQWTKYMDNPGIAIYNLGGDSKDKMISFAQLIGYPHPSAYIWNGKKWTNEKELERLLMIESGYVDLGFDHMCLCGDYVYIQSMFNDASFLMIGKMKK
jgi:hypothetical protein